MQQNIHILNGDALLTQFPQEILGERIVFRECLVDGPVDSNSLEDLYKFRAKFLNKNYPTISIDDYFNKSAKEIDRINAIPENSVINLWFEDDLFCQVNFWFILYLLKDKGCETFLVRPKKHTQFGFGSYNSGELIELLKTKTSISLNQDLVGLWASYKQNKVKNLITHATTLKQVFPFILNAVIAHVERLPTKSSKGRPAASLINIMNDLNPTEFSSVFKEFCKREPNYGFGDLQVKRIYNEILNI
ncbi:DUF1835 domain-containing protein [Urechidicola vernalis]|uniref:DUF1835 domain-containing protein n=1 Tax=Urechidicola vernalis TaxID=3075600 RepID=A0ABU2Y279_9FLAO|nr:DUF1835 domain-containing protein [Urechidicola sp. P050]MDT0552307.1 DUF1835 domain-containing protein [Urechidicola sp. P050]